MAVAVRTATRADVERVLALAVGLHEFTARGVPDRLRVPVEYDRVALQRLIEGMIADPEADLLVAFDGDQAVGFAELHMATNPDDPVVRPGRYVRLQSLVVAESHRGHGIGRLLVEATQRWATDRGITEVRLDCWEFDGGPEPFYRALGFRTVKREMARRIAGD